MTSKFLVSVLCGPFTAVSTALYIYIIIVIIRHRELRESAFYIINVVMGIVDIGSIWSIYLFHRIPALGLISSSYLSLGPHSIFSFMCTEVFAAFSNSQKYLLMAIGLNRFTAVVTPSIHKRVWSKQHCVILVLCIVIVNVIPAVVVEYVSPSYYEVKKNDSFGGIRCEMDSKTLYIASFYYTAYLSVFSATVNCCLYGFIVCTLFINQKNLRNANVFTINIYRIELKLTICVLFHTVLLVLDGATVTLAYLLGYKEFKVMNEILQDLLCGCNPYLLLLFSAQLRKKVFQFSIWSPSTTTSDPVFSAVGRNPR
ncbi:hypothetical protein QR680_007206 [Steinernema hermaphroditum]|uniref:G-protein coupled receptors family 1 profile domain-containing protein n=1 Tax=Steinernema hermaphroditum TaxID=289476 RepID=A0AA39LYF5_9BILA|nr:hypothetical protein QR680_007206 [Steinernema hermaphroditum]